MNNDKPAPFADAENREILLHGPEGIFLAFPQLAQLRQMALEIDRRVRAEEKSASTPRPNGDTNA